MIKQTSHLFKIGKRSIFSPIFVGKRSIFVLIFVGKRSWNDEKIAIFAPKKKGISCCIER